MSYLLLCTFQISLMVQLVLKINCLVWRAENISEYKECHFMTSMKLANKLQLLYFCQPIRNPQILIQIQRNSWKRRLNHHIIFKEIYQFTNLASSRCSLLEILLNSSYTSHSEMLSNIRHASYSESLSNSSLHPRFSKQFLCIQGFSNRSHAYQFHQIEPGWVP